SVGFMVAPSRNNVAHVVFEPGGDIRKQLRRQPQIDLRSLQPTMPEVCCEQRELGVEAGALPIPRLQSRNGERMAKAVDTWTTTAATVRDSAVAEEPAEDLVHAVVAVGSAVRPRKERAVGAAHPDTVAVRLQSRVCHGRQGYQTILLELAVPNREDSLVQVDIGPPQMERLAEP